MTAKGKLEVQYTYPIQLMSCNEENPQKKLLETEAFKTDNISQMISILLM